MSRVIDLTLSLASGDKGVNIEPAQRLEKEGWNATSTSAWEPKRLTPFLWRT